MLNNIIKHDIENIYSSEHIDWSYFKNKTILITGAYGMLASYFIHTFMYMNEIDKNYNIKVIALCKDKKKCENIFSYYISKSCFFILQNNLSESIECNQKIDYIIHAASPASSQFFGTNPVDVFIPNVIGSYHLLELARRNQVEGYLFLSSCEIYGKIETPYVKENYIGAVDTTDVRSCYGESKRCGENMCVSYAHQYGVPTRIVRLGHTYGPTMNLTGDSRVFSEFISDVINNNVINIKGDSSTERMFCYISDAIEGMIIALLKGNDGEAYNLLNESARINIGNLAKMLIDMVPQKQLKVVYKKRKNDMTYLESSIKRPSRFSIKKLQKLGFICKVSLEDGFTRTLKNFESEMKY